MRTRLASSPLLPLTAALLLLAANTASAAPTGTLSVTYTGYSHGLVVLKLAGSLTLTPDAYSAHVTFHTAGMAAWMLNSTNDSEAQGSFKGNAAIPTLFFGTGQLRSTKRLTRLEYQDGNPVVRALDPPQEKERTAVDPAATRHTIDTLSAAALLVRTVGLTGACDGSATTFDGGASRRKPPIPPAARPCRPPGARFFRARPCAAISRAASSPASCATRTRMN